MIHLVSAGKGFGARKSFVTQRHPIWSESRQEVVNPTPTPAFVQNHTNRTYVDKIQGLTSHLAQQNIGADDRTELESARDQYIREFVKHTASQIPGEAVTEFKRGFHGYLTGNMTKEDINNLRVQYNSNPAHYQYLRNLVNERPVFTRDGGVNGYLRSMINDRSDFVAWVEKMKRWGPIGPKGQTPNLLTHYIFYKYVVNQVPLTEDNVNRDFQLMVSSARGVPTGGVQWESTGAPAAADSVEVPKPGVTVRDGQDPSRVYRVHENGPLAASGHYARNAPGEEQHTLSRDADRTAYDGPGRWDPLSHRMQRVRRLQGVPPDMSAVTAPPTVQPVAPGQGPVILPLAPQQPGQAAATTAAAPPPAGPTPTPSRVANIVGAPVLYGPGDVLQMQTNAQGGVAFAAEEYNAMLYEEELKQEALYTNDLLTRRGVRLDPADRKDMQNRMKDIRREYANMNNQIETFRRLRAQAQAAGIQLPHNSDILALVETLNEQLSRRRDLVTKVSQNKAALRNAPADPAVVLTLQNQNAAYATELTQLGQENRATNQQYTAMAYARMAQFRQALAAAPPAAAAPIAAAPPPPPPMPGTTGATAPTAAAPPPPPPMPGTTGAAPPPPPPMPGIAPPPPAAPTAAPPAAPTVAAAPRPAPANPNAHAALMAQIAQGGFKLRKTPGHKSALQHQQAVVAQQGAAHAANTPMGRMLGANTMGQISVAAAGLAPGTAQMGQVVPTVPTPAPAAVPVAPPPPAAPAAPVVAAPAQAPAQPASGAGGGGGGGNQNFAAQHQAALAAALARRRAKMTGGGTT